jgi:hypothetical protein
VNNIIAFPGSKAEPGSRLRDRVVANLLGLAADIVAMAAARGSPHAALFGPVICQSPSGAEVEISVHVRPRNRGAR